MNYLQLYKGAVTEIINGVYQGDRIINPALSNKIMFTVRAYFISYTYVITHYQKATNPISLNESMVWLKENISSNCPFIYIYEQTEKQTNTIIDSYLIQLDSESKACNLGLLYETLLHTDVSENFITEGDLSRNKQGSYYSPVELASYLTKSVIDNYVKNNSIEDLNNARIIDFSCGSGIFLTEALRYIKELLILSDKDLIDLIKNVYACDVDFIALEICKFNILDLLNDNSVYCKLSSNFRQGNFLLETFNEKDDYAKIDAYLNGFIYHQDLSIGVDFLTEYDIILGNPPWEKIRFEEKSFYSNYISSLENVNFKSEIVKFINSSRFDNTTIEDYCNECKQQIEVAKKTIKKSTRFKASSVGELNTSNLFTEAAYNMISHNGTMGLIVKSSTVATTASKKLFDKISNRILFIIDFINKRKYFSIDGRERFSLLMLDGLKHNSFNLAMNIQDIKDVDSNLITVTRKNLRLLNPETGMIPNIASSKDLSTILSIYKKNDTIANIFPDLKFGRLVHLTNHADDIDKVEAPDNLSIYEGKFFSSFDGLFAGFNHIPYADRYKAKAHAGRLSNEDKINHLYPESRFFIKTNKWKALSSSYHADYMLAWHSLTSATNNKACVATLLPFMPASQSVQFLISDSEEVLIYLSCLFNSVVFDYLVKNKLTGIDLTQSFIKQIAIPNIDKAKQCLFLYNGEKHSALSLLCSICKQILKEDRRLTGLWPKDITYNTNLPLERNQLLIMMDIIVTHLYDINGEQIEYIFKSNSNYSSQEIDIIKEGINRILN